jgi:hypothetical protein
MDLKYYMLDWDDNILFMPTEIHLERDGQPVDVTTKDYATIRQDPSYGFLNGSADEAFAGFRDGTGDFVGDTEKAIEAKEYAPSFGAFKTALLEARLFSIVTARGHAAKTIRAGVERFISLVFTDEERSQMLDRVQHFNALAGLSVPRDECLSKYLDLNGYVGVSSPGFLAVFEGDEPGEDGSSAASPEEAKTYVVREFVEHALELAKNIPSASGRIAFGFSDDDRGNLAKMREFMEQELVGDYPGISFFVYDTSGSKPHIEQL